MLSVLSNRDLTGGDLLDRHGTAKSSKDPEMNQPEPIPSQVPRRERGHKRRPAREQRRQGRRSHSEQPGLDGRGIGCQSRLPEPVHPVIAGYDGSLSARRALAYAAGMASRLRRPLLVVHVAPFTDSWDAGAGQLLNSPTDAATLEMWLRSELHQVIGSSGLEVHIRIRRGVPAAELSVMAALFSADALVVGAPAHSRHRIAGSVSGWLARHAISPVVVVP